MARTVRWAQSALDDFDAAVFHLRGKNPRAAERMFLDLVQLSAGLSRRHTGRPGRVDGSFEKSAPKWRYVIAYQLQANDDGSEEVVIVRIIHTSRDWPKGSWPT